MKFIDAHIHLQDKAFEKDFDEVLAKAKSVGVEKFVCCSTSKKDWHKVLDLSNLDDCIIPCLGIHPWFVKNVKDEDIENLEKLILQNKNAFIGEAGLDKIIKKPFLEKQETVFKAQIELAKRHNRPLVCHVVKSWGWLLEIAKDVKMPEKFILHAYSGSEELIDELYKMGAYFSYGGSAINPNNKKTQKAIKATPLDRILIETDAPDMPPPQKFGKYTDFRDNNKPRNHPANIKQIYEQVAKIAELPIDKLVSIAQNNMCNLF
jgi:TatD DNase family protein